MARPRHYTAPDIKCAFDESRAKRFLPIVHDPRGVTKTIRPRALYYRVLRRSGEEAIQYMLYWMRQNCVDSFPIGLGVLFTHEYDYEPIIVFTKAQRVVKLVVAGAGGLLDGGHVTEVYGEDEEFSRGKTSYETSEYALYPFGRRRRFDSYLTGPIKRITFRGARPVLAIATCYHVYTTLQHYQAGPVISPPLRHLTTRVLTRWYRMGHFGHDVSDPWVFPHIRFSPPPKLKKPIGRRLKRPVTDAGDFDATQ